ncbi:hypothetical protein ACFSQD_00910 [Flavihumibacter stibioxidans]|uniref:hypothetical protein n=1 Tax=Flavihumibacter stibioxidans TaxID=1834163 RepID=UPI00164F7401|nr:hypothetical protein [Flavihumibacter stibioxidans]
MELRQIDTSIIEVREIEWQGPFAWTGYEAKNGLDKMPDTEGIYLWTFQYKDGYLVYCAGITKSTQKRFRQHTLEYKSGNYTVFNVGEAVKGKRVEIWHGWSYARTHREEFTARKEEILNAVEEQLKSFRVFVAQVSDKRERTRFEAAIMHNIYNSKEHWAGLADRGMALSKRKKDEVPIVIKNRSNVKLYGLPEIFDI